MAELLFTRRRLVVLGAALAISVALLMVAAEPAQALPSIGGVVDKAVKKIFGVKGDWITGTFLQWLITIPKVGLTSDGGPAQVYIVTRNIAFAALGAVLTLSCIHYLASGMTSRGGGAGLALEGVLRTGGAALMILAWPFLVDNGITLVHIASDIIVPGDKLGNITKVLLAGATLGKVFGGGVPMIMAMVVTLAFELIILIIFITKMMLGATLIVIASGIPLAFAIWPLPSLSWLANGLARWCVGIVSVQLAWAVEFGVYARVPGDFLHWRGAGAFVDKLIAPLTMIALLLLMLSTARSILRLAGISTSGGGMVTNAVSLMASRFAMSAVSRHVPNKFGRSKTTLAERSGQGGPRNGKGGAASALSSANKAAGAANRAMRTAAQTSRSNGGWTQAPGPNSNGPNRQSSEPSAEGEGSGPAEPPRVGVGHDGIPTRSGHKEAHREALDRLDRLRAAGTSKGPGDVANALDTVQASGLDAQAVANHLGAHSANDRHVMGRMADAELAPGLSPQASRAFRTIGVAEPGSRAAGLSLWQSQQASSSGPAGNGGSPAANGGSSAANGGSSAANRGSPAGNGGSPPRRRASRPAGPPAQPPPPTQNRARRTKQ